MRIPDSLAIELLKKSGEFSDPQIDALYEESKRHKLPLQDLIVGSSLLSEAELTRLYAEEIGLPFVELNSGSIQSKNLSILDERLARRHKAVVFGNEADNVKLVALEDPNNVESLNFLKKELGSNLKVHITTPQAMNATLSRYPMTRTRLIEKQPEQELEQGNPEGVAINSAANETLHLIIENAILDRATDIHIEPRENYVLVRYRIDGMLRPVTKLPLNLIQALVDQARKLAKLSGSSDSLVQNGSFRLEYLNKIYSIKLSLLPLIDGNKIVLSMQDDAKQPLDFDTIGLWGLQLNNLAKSIVQPHGLILVAGPAGAGNSTTLASILSKLNAPGLSVATLENPIIYRLANASQLIISENEDGVSYSTGLKAVIDQGANVIMIDKLQDKSLAAMTLNAATNGRLVFSSLHAQSASDAIAKLKNIGIDPYLAASATRLIIAQKLVRKLCTQCRQPFKPSPTDTKKFEKEFGLSVNLKAINKLEKAALSEGLGKHEGSNGLSSDAENVNRLWHAAKAGCKNCGFTGYSGRIGIFEVMIISEEIQKLIATKASSKQIEQAALKEGMISLKIDGLVKSLRGLTTVDEVVTAV
jgi:type IV pilus assembly protein PilB